MRLGIRARIFAISILLVAITMLAGGGFLELELERWTEARVESELLGYARAVKHAVESNPDTDLDELADDLGQALSARVTIVAQSGAVVGDSTLASAELDNVENHGVRPEIEEAMKQGVGRAIRRSHTIGTDMLYVAVPFTNSRGTGVVRVATKLSQVESLIYRLRLLLVLAGLAAGVVAVGMSFLASHFMSRTLRELVGRAHELAASVFDRQPSQRPSDDLAGLAGSLEALAQELDRKVSTIASERDRFRAVLHGLNEAVIAVDGARHITLVNESAILLLGLDDPPNGRVLRDVVPNPTLDEMAQRSISSGQDQTAELEIIGVQEPPTAAEFGDPDGRATRLKANFHRGMARMVAARAMKLRASEGCVLVLHDVTEVRRLEAVRRDFVANVSHELRTPVSIIRANAETLLDGAIEDKARAGQFLDALVRNADRLSRILADLLDLSRLEAGRYALDMEATSIRAVAQRVTDALEIRAKERSLLLTNDVPSELMAVADPRALEQVLQNLVDNAVKYTPVGGKVSLSARPLNDKIRVEVSDDGPGIEPKHRSRLFERFYRVDPGRSREVGGTGLGLAIVKHLAESMGGRVGMEPVIPHGSTFWVTLDTVRSAGPASSDPHR